MHYGRAAVLVVIPLAIIGTHVLSEEFAKRRCEAEKEPCPECTANEPPPGSPRSLQVTGMFRTRPWVQWINGRAQTYYDNKESQPQARTFIKKENPMCVPTWTVKGKEAVVDAGAPCVMKPLGALKSLPKGRRVVMLGDEALLHIITKTMEQAPEVQKASEGADICWSADSVTVCVHLVEGRGVTGSVAEVGARLGKGDLIVVMVGSMYDRAPAEYFTKVATQDPEIAQHEARARRLLRDFVAISDEALVARLHADTTVTLLRAEPAVKRGVKLMWVTPLPRFIKKESPDGVDGNHFETRLVQPVTTCTSKYSDSFVREHAIAAAFEDASDMFSADPISHLVDVSSGMRMLPQDFEHLETTNLTRSPDGFPKCVDLKSSVAAGLGQMILKGVSRTLAPRQISEDVSKWTKWMATSAKGFWGDRSATFSPASPLCTPTWEYDTATAPFKATHDEHLSYLGYGTQTEVMEKAYIGHSRNYEYCPLKMRASGCQDRLVKLLECMEPGSSVWFIGDSTITLPYLRLVAEGGGQGVSPKVDTRECLPLSSPSDKSRVVNYCLHPGGGRTGPRAFREVFAKIGANDVVVVMLGAHYSPWINYNDRKDKVRFRQERNAAATIPEWVPDEYHNLYSRLHGDINQILGYYRENSKPTQRLVWVTPLPQFFHLEGNLAPSRPEMRLTCLNTTARVGMVRELIVSQAIKDSADIIDALVDISSAERAVDGSIVSTVTSPRGDCSHACVDVNTVLARMLVHGVCKARGRPAQ
eukprot:TRINITY_DN23573_c0_g1_i1.p1 TRINITY_DN23573_c0_g1~~TRINITY_DN23573_c0_g1_i1.p1  ORF type:complete len:774 (+),score=132.66 TRINITY_DN23573_c0_g1_i1:45-2324(+)